MLGAVAEAKVQSLLRGDDDDRLGKVYDGRLVWRILHYIQPYRTPMIISMTLMILSSSVRCRARRSQGD